MNDEQAMQRIAAAVGRIPSGLGVLTARHHVRSTGILASWFQQASFQPVMFTVCVKRGRFIQSLIDGSGRLALNVLGEDPKVFFRHFAAGFNPDQDAFADLHVHSTDYGVRLADAIAYLGGTVVHKVPAGDHDVYVAQVMEGSGFEASRPHVHVRKSGQAY
jgi:flavin reductase (DIM6/NTAB) family NADH-FMN oxidoreductase RutF